MAPSPAALTLDLAGRQHGIVTRAQLLQAGVSRRVVEHRVEQHWLRPMHRGVYLVGPLTPPRAREIPTR